MAPSCLHGIDEIPPELFGDSIIRVEVVFLWLCFRLVVHVDLLWLARMQQHKGGDDELTSTFMQDLLDQLIPFDIVAVPPLWPTPWFAIPSEPGFLDDYGFFGRDVFASGSSHGYFGSLSVA